MTALTDEQLIGLAKNFDGAGPDYLANRLLATIATLKAEMAQAERALVTIRSTAANPLTMADPLQHFLDIRNLADQALRDMAGGPT